jgi:hypothetical protein
MGIVLNMYLGIVIPQQVLLFFVLSLICYFCENKYKQEFLSIKYNKKLKNEFKLVLDLIPEGIVIYDPNNNSQIM